MINKANQIKFLTLIALIAGFAWGNLQEVKAQAGDPFAKPSWAKPKPPGGQAPTTTTTKDGKVIVKTEKPIPPPVVPMMAPAIQDRINYFKVVREKAANEGKPLPKVTNFLTLNEMVVTGIFRTPRGFAAMVQANALGLSYPVYPGEKFFDGQLVAIEENRLVFRKVVQMSNGKFIVSEENKTLRLYTEQEEIQGTAPVDATTKGESKAAEAAQAQAAAQPVDPTKPVQPVSIVSPLEAMNRQPVEAPKTAKEKNDKSKKGKSSGKTSSAKKPAKVAVNKEQ
jgi:hypothetical protein